MYESNTPNWRATHPQQMISKTLRLFKQTSNVRVQYAKLVMEFNWIQKLTQIVTIIIRRIVFSMIRGRDGCHFMAIDCIVFEEVFDFAGDFLYA